MNPVGLLWFIGRRSLRNLVVRQARRLRQPRYLLPFAVGLYYFWRVFAPHGPPLERKGLGSFLEVGVLALVLMTVLWSWAFGGDEASIRFSEAEIQLLFSAPMTRRQLLSYKLVRTLALSLVTSLLLVGMAGRYLAGWSPRLLLGTWLAVSTIALHGIAASLTRASLLQHGAHALVRRALPALVPVAVIAAAMVNLRNAGPAPATPGALSTWLQSVISPPPFGWIVLPLKAAIDVALGPESALAISLPAAILSLGAHWGWVLWMDASFEESALALAERRAQRIAQWRKGQLPLRAGRAPWRLAAHGPPAVAIYWKNLTAAVRLLSLRMVIALLIMPASMLVLTIALGGAAERQELAAGALMMFAFYLTLMGSQIYRIDFRFDLPNIDLLRTLPLQGWEIAAAEVLAPVSILVCAQWLCLVGATVLVPQGILPTSPLATALALGLALPCVTLCLVEIQNASALLFPAWTQPGLQGRRGIEALGQRLLTFAATIVVLAVAFVPAALIGGGGALLVSLVAGLGDAALLVGSALASAVLLVESAIGVRLLGRAFDRFDLAQT